MTTRFYMVAQTPKWKKLEYSKSQVRKAGRVIKNKNMSQSDFYTVIPIIDNWRASHAYPMHNIYTNLRRMVKDKPEIVVAERLKRLDSIIKKLQREPNMNLLLMQDLGGCRFVTQNIRDVYKYSSKFRNSRKRHLLKETYDYIQHPKLTGYRSLHTVYEFKSVRNTTYNGMFVEIQFRTHLQHVWATAVETVGLFFNQDIKANIGDEKIRRFFALVSSLFALIENMPVVPGTSNNEEVLLSEIRAINEETKLLPKLEAIQIVSKLKGDEKIKKGAAYYILILNYSKKSLFIKHFDITDVEKVNRVYTAIESQSKDLIIDAVMVQVRSFNTLKTAYPNYFSDIGEFLTIIHQKLEYMNK